MPIRLAHRCHSPRVLFPVQWCFLKLWWSPVHAKSFANRGRLFSARPTDSGSFSRSNRSLLVVARWIMHSWRPFQNQRVTSPVLHFLGALSQPSRYFELILPGFFTASRLGHTTTASSLLMNLMFFDTWCMEPALSSRALDSYIESRLLACCSHILIGPGTPIFFFLFFFFLSFFFIS